MKEPTGTRSPLRLTYATRASLNDDKVKVFADPLEILLASSDLLDAEYID